MIRTYTALIFASLFLNGCISNEPKDNNSKEPLGELTINYYSDKSVNSLEVPPDLTSPESQKSFRISEYVKDINEQYISFSEDSKKS